MIEKRVGECAYCFRMTDRFAIGHFCFVGCGCELIAKRKVGNKFCQPFCIYIGVSVKST